MIVVTGANGQLGRLIVEKLLERVPAVQIGVSVRDPSQAQSFAARGVRVRRGDFTDATSLAHAFAGASQLLLVSSNSAARGGDTLTEHRTAIEAARASGVKRIVYTSHAAASASSAFSPTVMHAASEELLRASGLSWTAVRNGFYASAALTTLGRAVNAGVLEVPRDGRVAWTAHGDLAEAAAVILTQEGKYEGPTLPLTGPEALDYAELCVFVSELRKHPLQRTTISEDQFRSNLSANGIPDTMNAISVGFFRASYAGEFAKVDGALRDVLGREPTSIRRLLVQQFGAGCSEE